MTVKHKVDGKEKLTSAHSVEFDARTSVLTAFDAEEKPLRTYTGGTAFVTNDTGQTVGIYNLNKK